MLDVRVPGTNGKKVYLCHVSPGNPGNPQTLSISVNAVQGHIPAHTGDQLGQCSQSCDNLGLKSEEETGILVVSPTSKLETVVYPNPFSAEFTVMVESESQEPVSLHVYDLAGKMMMEIRDVAPNTPEKVWNNLTYGFNLLQVHQESEVQNIKIVKSR